MSSFPSNTPSPSFCGTTLFPISCPIMPPTDGFGGSCANIPFLIPLCLTSNTSDSTASVQSYLSYALLDYILVKLTTRATIHSIALALSALTLVNVLVLTPERKRGLAIHTAILLGLVAQIVRSACFVWLCTQQVSSYLAFTGDYASPEWSVQYRVVHTLVELMACLVLVCVHWAFFIQARALLTWVRLRLGLLVYHCVLGILVVAAAVSWVYIAAFAGYQIVWVAFVHTGENLLAIENRWWWLHLYTGSTISTTVSLLLWSTVFAVSTGKLLWDEHTTFLSLNRDLTMQGLQGQNPYSRGRSTYQKGLRLMGMVGVESFLVPIVLCLFNLVAIKTLSLEALIIPCLLALLPTSSLFIGSNVTTVEQKGEASYASFGSYRPSTNANLPTTDHVSSSSRNLVGRCIELDSGHRALTGPDVKAVASERTVDRELLSDE